MLLLTGLRCVTEDCRCDRPTVLLIVLAIGLMYILACSIFIGKTLQHTRHLLYNAHNTQLQNLYRGTWNQSFFSIAVQLQSTFLVQSVAFLGPQNAAKSLAAGASPQTPLGELTALPQTP